MFVGNLADRIQSNKGRFVTSWEKLSGLNRGQVVDLQKRLIQQGYDVGGADGFAGFKTRRSIGEWQQKNNLLSSCFPSANLVRRLK